MPNRTNRHLTTLAYQQSEQRMSLLTGVNLHALLCRITAEITVAANTTAPTVLEDSVLRLINSMRVQWNGFDLVTADVGARDLWRLNARQMVNRSAITEPADGTAQTDTAIEAFFVLYFARPEIANPIETIFPGTALQQVEGRSAFRQLELIVGWSRDTANSGDDAGTGAIFTGGDATVTWGSEPVLTVEQVYSTDLIRPRFLPVLTVPQPEQFTAANANLLLGLEDFPRRILHSLVLAQESADETMFDAVTDVTLESSPNARIWEDWPGVFVQEEDGQKFPAVAAGGEAGEYFLPFAEGGRLTLALDPKDHAAPALRYNVIAPTTSPGVLRHLTTSLMERAGVTRPFGQGRG